MHQNYCVPLENSENWTVTSFAHPILTCHTCTYPQPNVSISNLNKKNSNFKSPTEFTLKNTTSQNLHTLQSAVILFISLPLSPPPLLPLLTLFYAWNALRIKLLFVSQTFSLRSTWNPPDCLCMLQQSQQQHTSTLTHNVISQIELSVAHFNSHSNEYSSFHSHAMHYSMLDDKYNRKS